MADETTTSQPAPEVARVWHTQVDRSGYMMVAFSGDTRADAERDTMFLRGTRAITVVERPPREAVEALLDAHAIWCIAEGHGDTKAQDRDDMRQSAANARAALLRLWGFDA